MGNPDFAVPSLDVLNNSRHDVVAVVSSPDRPKGRGRIISGLPVANKASKLGLKLIQPYSMNNAQFFNELSEINADIFVVIAFKILPQYVFQIPKFGSINLHPSFLPKYRGAAPIQHAIMNGENSTGITTFYISNKVDAGDILLTTPLLIFPDDDSGDLSMRASFIGADLILKTINLISSGFQSSKSQEKHGESKAPKINSTDRKIDWTRTNVEIKNKIRALSPFPGAYTKLGKQRLGIYKVSLSFEEYGFPGNLKVVRKSSLMVQCGSGSVIIEEIHPEGKKRMTGSQFLNGTNVYNGDYFE
tara:strand:- start:26099 stop:27007 length:909 start_codon:yes stop_codon:yes gene_type:complete